MVAIINEHYPDDVACPEKNCNRAIQNYEIQGILSREEYEVLEKQAINKVVEQDQSLVQCACGNVMELL